MARSGLAHAVMVHALLALGTAVAVLPILYALQISTLGFQDVFVFPPRIMPGGAFLDNLTRAWEKVGLGRLLANSLAISLAVALGKIVLSVMAAFAFTYFGRFREIGRAHV